jgi:hypothetical protein
MIGQSLVNLSRFIIPSYNFDFWFRTLIYLVEGERATCALLPDFLLGIKFCTASYQSDGNKNLEGCADKSETKSCYASVLFETGSCSQFTGVIRGSLWTVNNLNIFNLGLTYWLNC